ncbi:uncharacterized protein LOC130436125 [Triplophysa dalaica]|uniref:uncharacterized protein LOC130436125 n=1 Tax=Triplophysa dalaica TaxID=1582913 RepID=UPI0024DF9A56|nr:uncharacterized protein LOC130436125 [Triplophysa dalaica]
MMFCCVVCVWIFLTEIRSSSTNGIETHGYTGKHVTISCQHSWAWSNRKYFCRDPCEEEDILVSSDRSPNGRFSLKYLGKGTSTVTITDLKETDSGIYWCGVDRVGVDTYEKVNLRVSKGKITVFPFTVNKPHHPVHFQMNRFIPNIDITQTLPISTQQQESQLATSSRTSRSSTLEHTTHVPSVTVSSVSVNIWLYAVGGLIAIVILVCGPVAVCHYKKLVKTAEGLVPVTTVYHNEDAVEEDTNLYENDDQDTRNSKKMKSKMLESEVLKSQSHSVYENVELKPGQSHLHQQLMLKEARHYPQRYEITEDTSKRLLLNAFSSHEAHPHRSIPKTQLKLMEIRGLLLKMRFYCVLSFWIFLSEVKTSSSEELFFDGRTGKVIIISCHHVFAKNNRKYFCRDPCKYRDVLVSSDRSPNGRFTLNDSMTGTFTVSITDLQESDSGIYWCGVDRVGVDTFHKINLRVHEESETHTASIQELTTRTDSVFTSPNSETSTHTPLKTGLVKASSSPDAFTDEDAKAVPVYSVLYVVVGLVVMLTVISVGLVCVCRYKERLQTSARGVSRTSTHVDNEFNSDEGHAVYENYLDASANATKQMPKHKTKDLESTEDPIYQNVCDNTGHEDGFYTDL